MLKYNGKEFRNLEDQVGYLTDAFKSGKLIDELGIKVLGVFPTLDTAKDAIRPPYEYGDAFSIGTEKPYNLYIYTRNIEDFFDFGPFPVPGPQGKSGPTPSISINASVTDTTGTPEAVVVKTGTDEAPIFNFTFKNIKGERGQTGVQGIQGPRGFQGPTGPIGPKGNTGPKGDVGPAFKLLGDLTSTSQLPSPTAELQAQGAAYTIPNAQGIKHIWVIQGTDNLLWTDIGESGVQGPKGDPGTGINDLQTVIDIGAPSVTYNTTNGITINNTERYTYSSGQVDVSTEKKIPLIAGEGISIDATNGADKVTIKTLDTNIKNGTGKGSLVQKRLKSDGVTWTTAKAYQGAGAAFGGNTQSGRTETEFNNYFWDSTKNVPLHGGKGKDSNGNILDNNGLNYAKSYSYALAEGESTKALGRSSHAEGNDTQSIGNHSHAEGLRTKAEGYASHAEGYLTNANGGRSHSEGESTKSEGLNSHAEGGSTLSSGTYSHSEGESTKALGRSSHAEGNATQSIGDNSHSEGLSTKAEGYAAHTEGAYTEAYYTGSHAEGNHTKTYAPYQHVSGTYNHYNINALYQVGNGTSDNDRKNAFEVLKDGTICVPNFDSNGNRIGMVALKVINGELKITT